MEIRIAMSTNKFATIRYQALDRCFSNKHREFTIWDLVQACNDAIYEYSGDDKYRVDAIRDHDDHEGVKKRQIYNDIKYMESEAGWSIELEKFRNSRNQQCYRYADTNFSINRRDLTSDEMDKLKETILMLNRFRGMPHFEWMQDVLTHLEDKFKLRGTEKPVIGFDQNLDFTGLNLIEPLFGAITNKQPLFIHYHSNRGLNFQWVIHPYYLKEFNNRWFLFGYCEEEMKITNLALDRIESYESAVSEYRENTDIDFEEFFDDIVGVTIPPNAKLEHVILKFAPSRFHYVQSKPIHLSQKPHGENTIDIEVKVNRELESLIFSFGDDVEVLEPEWLRHRIVTRLSHAIDNYNNVIS